MRALVIAAVVMLIGLVVVLMGELLDSNLLLKVIGFICLAAGLGLFGLALWATIAVRVTVQLDDDGYALVGRGVSESGKWLDVERVTRSSDRITIYNRDGTRLQLWVARGAVADLDALSRDIAQRLDANRGYGAI